MIFQYYGYTQTPAFLQVLLDWGLVSFFLPFILLAAIVYGILQKIAIFKTSRDQPNKRLNLMVAMIVAAMIVAPHTMGLYTQQGIVDPVDAMLSFIPQGVLLLVVILLIMLLVGITGAKVPNTVVRLGAIIALGIFVFLVAFALFPAFFPLPQQLARDLAQPGTQALIFALLVFGLFFWFMTQEEETDPAKKKDKALSKVLHSWFEE